jgi:HK97 family phage major capsid protein
MFASINEKRDAVHRLLTEVKGIVSDPKATLEDKGRVDGLMEDVKALQADIARLSEIDKQMADLKATATTEQPDPAVDARKSNAKFEGWVDYLQAIRKANPRQGRGVVDPRLQWFREDKDESGHESKAPMVESVGAQGGFLVPAEFRAQLMAAQAEKGIVRQRASIIRMNRRQIDIPVLDQTGTTAGSPHWFGGAAFYWAEEAAEKTVTDFDFRKVQLVAHKLIGYTRASDELVDDSAISLGDFISGPLGFAGGVAWMEDYAFLRGTGAGQPLGVINAGATITVARQQQLGVTYTDLVNMLEDFLPGANGVWVIHQSVMSNLLTMQDNAGGAGTGTYIWGSTTDGVPSRLLGYPVVWTEKVPRIASAGDVGLYDFSYYLIGDRQATTIESTQYDYWRYDQTSWRVVHRVDGQPWLSAPLTLQDGTSQVSPFVILGAKTT